MSSQWQRHPRYVADLYVYEQIYKKTKWVKPNFQKGGKRKEGNETEQQILMYQPELQKGQGSWNGKCDGRIILVVKGR